MVFGHLRYNLLIIFARGPIVYGVQRINRAPFLRVFVALKIDKNQFDVKKLHPPKWGGVVSTKEYSQSNNSCSLLSNISKNL
jgi:hypothetical protein